MNNRELADRWLYLAQHPAEEPLSDYHRGYWQAEIDTYTQCADELQAALRAAPEGWRDIESAPKDGTWVLAWPCYSEGVHRVRWGGKRPPCWQDFMGRVPKPPTHWQPLPEPPP